MIRCGSCGLASPPGMKFCGGCGRPLAADARDAERRQLTVMFCDLAGSAALADTLDPEELRDLIGAYQQAAGDAIRAFDGHIAQYLGDGMLVYFGYPVAHEDDARRAVHTALRLLTSMQTLNARLPPARQLAVRIGIHTGDVVVGSVGTGGTAEQLALGATPNVAARLQEAAPSNAIVVSGQTRALLKEMFACEALGPRSLKGFAQPVLLYLVTGLADATRTRRPDAQLVGRGREAAELVAVFDEVKAGHGRAVIVSAEAGVGKSRFVQAFQERLANEACAWYEAACSPYEQSSALRPVAALVARLLDVTRDSPAPEALLGAAADRAGLDREEAIPLLAALLGLPVRGAHAASAWSPQKQRERTMDIVAALLMAQAALAPVIVFLEDLHWADPSTVEFLRLLIARASGATLLLLGTSRPEHAPEVDGPSTRRIVLDPLGKADVAQIATRVARGKTLPASLIDQIAEKTDGVPLFVEELTKAILESGALVEHADRFDAGEAAGTMRIPASLQASLTARLDRLSSGKEVAQRAAVIGREFTFAMLKAIADRDEPALVADLGRLVEAELLFQHGVPPDASFAFKHALIRDAAYDMLLKSTRRECHGRVAQAMTGPFAEMAAARPELAAHHFTEAGQLEPAAEYWLRAGQQGTRQSANFEAVTHFKRGLSVLAGLEALPAREHLEMSLQTSLGSTLVFTQGYTSEAVVSAFERAHTLNQRIADPSKNLWITLGILNFRNVRGEVVEARRVADEILAAATAGADPVFRARASAVAGWSRFFRGDFAASNACTADILAMPEAPDADFQNYVGVDVRATVEAFSGMAAWHLGDLPRSLERSRAAVARARHEAHAYSRAVTLSYGAWAAHFRRDYAEARQLAAEQAAVCEKHGFPGYAWFAPLLLGWADAVDPAKTPAEPAIDPLMLINAVTGAGVALAIGFFSTMTAETLMRLGRREQARAALARALSLIESTGDHFWAAETYRIQAALCLDEGDAPEAETFLERAIDTARRQQSHSLALRAAVDLAHLWRRQGREAEARDLAGGAYSRVSHDIDAPDLASARAFLSV